MKLFQELLSYIRREPWTALMVTVLTAAWLATQFGSGSSGPSGIPADPHSEAQRLETTRRIEAFGAQIQQVPQLAAVMGMAVFLVLALAIAGLVWGIALARSLRRGERWMDRYNTPRTPWGIQDAFRAVVLLFFLDLVFSTAIGAVFGWLGIQTTHWALMLGALLRSGVLIVYLGAAVRRHGGSWKDLGICGNRLGSQAVWGLGGYLAMIPVYLGVLAVLAAALNFFQIQMPVQTPVQILYTESNTAAVMGFAFFMGILGPWFEEIFFRGFIYPAFKNRLGTVRAVVAVSVIFAALHAHGIAFMPILVLGLALNVLYERSGSIIPGAVLHMTHNCAMLALTLVIRQAMQS